MRNQLNHIEAAALGSITAKPTANTAQTHGAVVELPSETIRLAPQRRRRRVRF